MDYQELKTTANLAMMDLHEDETAVLSHAVTDMLEYFALMQQVDVTGLEPTTHALSDTATVRSDEINLNPINPENLVNRAADTDNNQIVIPNVL